LFVRNRSIRNACTALARAASRLASFACHSATAAPATSATAIAAVAPAATRWRTANRRARRQASTPRASIGGDGRVALVRPLRERLADDRVEVARKRAREAARGRGAARARGFVGGGSAGAERLVLEDRALERARVVAVPVRSPAGEELVEHDAERVDVGRRADRRARDLLGRRVGGGQRAARDPRELGLARLAVRDELRDAEVEQARLARVGDEDVRGFEVAVDDEVRVRVLHGAQHLQEQRDARLDRKPARIRPFGDRPPFDVLHREPGLAVGRDARVVEPRDVRMRQRREDLALAREAPGDRARVDALGEPHRAHAAHAQLAHEAPGADEAARREVLGRGRPPVPERIRPLQRRVVEPVGGPGASGREQELAQERRVTRVVAGELVQPRFARGRGQVERLVEQPVERAQRGEVEGHRSSVIGRAGARARRASGSYASGRPRGTPFVAPGRSVSAVLRPAAGAPSPSRA